MIGTDLQPYSFTCNMIAKHYCKLTSAIFKAQKMKHFIVILTIITYNTLNRYALKRYSSNLIS